MNENAARPTAVENDRMAMALDYISMAREQRGAGDMIARLPTCAPLGPRRCPPVARGRRAVVTLAIASGLYFSFPIFYVALLAEFGLVGGATAAAFSISSGRAGGALTRRRDCSWTASGHAGVMLGGACLLGGACVCRPDRSLWALYLVTECWPRPAVCAVSWIRAGRLIARGSPSGEQHDGARVLGHGRGLLVIGPLAQWLIVGYGWRVAYLVLGLGTLIVLVPLISLGVREPTVAAPPLRGDLSAPDAERASAGWNVGDAVRTRAFWALFFAYLCTPLAVFSSSTHQSAFAVDHGFRRCRRGHLRLTGLLSTVGRIVFGFVADWIGRATSATISYGCTAVGTLCLLSLDVWPQAAGLYAYAIFFGLGFGAAAPSSPRWRLSSSRAGASAQSTAR